MTNLLALKNDIARTTRATAAPAVVPCHLCPLRRLEHVLPCTPAELNFIAAFKHGEITVAAGETVFREGEPSPRLFTVLTGWAFRYKSLSDGRRQILNYVLPGDLIGLQAALDGNMEHGIEALTDLRLCVFPRERLDTLFRHHPGLARDITWLAAHEERLLDDHLLAVGRRRSSERIAYLLWHLASRARALGLAAEDGTVPLPVSQQHLADTLGMSLVTFNKTLQRLRARGAFTFDDRRLRVLDEAALIRMAAADATPPPHRPII